MACYRDDCGPYEMFSCSECPASKPDYRKEKEQRKMTNGDRIRQMSNEELAVLCENGCPPNYPCPDFEEKEIGERKLCQRCWLDWLRREATNDA